MKKNIIMLFATCILAVMLAGCPSSTGTTTPSVDNQQAVAQETNLQEATRQIGMPNIKNFTEMKELKALYEARDDSKLITYTYLADLNGNLHFLCRSVGYGFPYATQFSNPHKLIDGATHQGGYSGWENYVMDQAEPNGLYPSPSSNGTWVNALNEEKYKTDGTISYLPIYVEPNVTVSPFKLKSVD